MSSRLLTVDEYRAKLREDADGSVGSSVMTVSVSEPKAVEGAPRTFRFCLSDGSVDRMGDTINVHGWEIADYMRNPVVLWAHNSLMPPIGRASNVGVVNGRLMGDIEFIAAADNAFADSIFRMVAAGFIKATSVGFRPLEYAFVEDSTRPWGIDFKRQELLEDSVVPVPANANALIAAKAAGMDISPLRGWAERVGF